MKKLNYVHLLFGIGMTLTSGCGNKTLIRFGGGNLKSLVVLVIAGAMAYLMTRTDFYGLIWVGGTYPNGRDVMLIMVTHAIHCYSVVPHAGVACFVLICCM